MQYTSTERRLIEGILDAPTEAAPRLAYAAWLDAEGEVLRAKILRATCIASHAFAELQASLAELPTAYAGWSRLIGAQLIQHAHAQGFEDFIARWLLLARPALELKVGEPTEGLPLGASRLWGDPDLPPNTRWPTFADCKRWEPHIQLPPESPCQFIAQINLAELAATPAARALPRSGLLSIFTHHEWEHTGSAGIYLRYFKDTSALERVPHVDADEWNERIAPHAMELVESLTIPDDDAFRGPFAAAVGLIDCDYATSKKYREVRFATGEFYGLLGHDSATTGGDPTPGEDWERLLVLPSDPSGVGIHHLSIERAKLLAGELEDHRLVWIDVD